MRVDIADPQWSYDANGARISFSVPFMADAQRITAEMLKTGKHWVAEIKQKRNIRSKDANAMMWGVLTEMAKLLQNAEKRQAAEYTPDYLYRQYIRHSNNFYIATIHPTQYDRMKRDWESHGLAWFCDRQDYAPNGNIYVRLYYGSSQYDTKEMATLIDAILQDAQALGIDNTNPDFAALLEAYPDGQ